MAIKFDLSSVPATSTINSAKLEIYQEDRNELTGPLNDTKIVAYQIKRSWNGENVTWDNYDTDKKWDVNGGDIYLDKNYSDSVRVNKTQKTGWISFEMKNAVADQVKNSDQNYGIMLTIPGGPKDSVETMGETLDQLLILASSYASEANRPKLTVKYVETAITLQQNRIPANIARISQQGRSISLSLSAGTSAMVKLVSVTGKIIAQQQINGGSKTALFEQQCTPGVYSLAVSSKGKLFSTKVVVH